ncbi:hypothetical protein SAMN05192552_1002112 [Natrinema hispanicum]|uniref:Uncharacterized protein n=1 Tax=Natrinema hispanicum TaxID=392421 RepID=A0A1H9YH96_9EURY|nr:hypothetical protein SAMN05192552_1002112 [Natrinema hispanicum]SES68413.1 hypothetical protein SAMN04488694_101112 [Natrinema hispanicum]
MHLIVHKRQYKGLKENYILARTTLTKVAVVPNSYRMGQFDFRSYLTIYALESGREQ